MGLHFWRARGVQSPRQGGEGGELMPVPRYRSRNLRGRVMFADCPFSAWAVSLFEI